MLEDNPTPARGSVRISDEGGGMVGGDNQSEDRESDESEVDT